MSKQQQTPKREAWERWDWVWHAVGYAALGTLIAIVFRVGLFAGSLPLFLILSALLALWNIPFIATQTEPWREQPQRTFLYFLVGFGLWGGLFAHSEYATLLVAMFYPLIFSRFSIRWAIGALIVNSLLFLLLYIWLHSADNWVGITLAVLGLMAGAILIGLFISALIEQSIERQRLVDKLTQTRASLLKAEREAGTLAERQRLARDIHDTLAQQFTSIIMHLSAARLGDSGTVQTHVGQAEQAARDGLAEARRIIWDMQPEQLEQASLVESIEEIAARWSVENGVEVETAVTGTSQSLSDSVEIGLLRITQEALHNIKKHASARSVNITLSFMPNLFALDVADDGSGFDTKRKQRGFGLKTMRERAEGLGGTLTLESEPGSGTAVAVSLPLEEEV